MTRCPSTWKSCSSPCCESTNQTHAPTAINMVRHACSRHSIHTCLVTCDPNQVSKVLSSSSAMRMASRIICFALSTAPLCIKPEQRKAMHPVRGVIHWKLFPLSAQVWYHQKYYTSSYKRLPYVVLDGTFSHFHVPKPVPTATKHLTLIQMTRTT